MKLFDLYREIARARGHTCGEEVFRRADSFGGLNREITPEEAEQLRPLLLQKAKEIDELTQEQKMALLKQYTRTN